MEQLLQYEIISRLEVAPSQGGQGVHVRQTVISGRLLKADPTSQSTYAAALKNLAGTTMQYELNEQNRVTKFRGGKAARKPIAIDKLSIEKLLDSKGFLLTSLIDDDGWKELAELTFFQPDPQSRQWKTQFHHDWSPLGSWSGETTFATSRKRGKWQIYQYQHDAKYRPPGKDDKGESPVAVAGLPFALTGAEFRTLKNGGQIVYDTSRRRMESAEELFHVQGAVNANVLGQAAQVKLEEKQVFRIQISEQNRWQQ